MKMIDVDDDNDNKNNVNKDAKANDDDNIDNNNDDVDDEDDDDNGLACNPARTGWGMCCRLGHTRACSDVDTRTRPGTPRTPPRDPRSRS